MMLGVQRYYIEYSLMHELSHARYLSDLYSWNINPHTEMDDVKVLKQDGTKLLEKGAKKLYECGGGMMSCVTQHGRERLYSEEDVSALNRIAGKRAKCGNYNAPCNIGEYLLEIPAENKVRVLNQVSQPISSAQVSVYQSIRDPIENLDFYDKLIDDTADINCVTDSNGVCSLGSRPFGAISTGWDAFLKGVALIKITKNNQEYFRWLYLAEANMEYAKGNANEATFTITASLP